jgi:hypothetical protein
MIKIGMHLWNPLARSNVVSLWAGVIRMWSTKMLEVELDWEAQLLAEAAIDITFRQSHAGVCITLGLFGYLTRIHFYDIRHWDYEVDQWYDYEEDIV